MIVGVILAGGLSTRMGGGDKPLLALGGRPILAHVIERLGPQVDRLALNANGDPARFAGFGLPVLADSIAGYAGPLAGVLAGMDWAAGLGADAIVTAAGDTPFFPDDLVASLRRAALAEGMPLAIAVTPGAAGPDRHPTFGLWPVGLRDDLRSALEGGMRRVLDWTEAKGSAHALFRGIDAFFNVNAPADLARAQVMYDAVSRALFDTVVIVDWSSRSLPSPSRPSPDAIWIAVEPGGESGPRYFRTRAKALDYLGYFLSQERSAGRRTLVGFDFPLGYPRGFAAALTGRAEALAVWEMLATMVRDGPDNANNRFDVAAALNARFPDGGPFWGRPAGRDLPTLPVRGRGRSHGFPEGRLVEARVRSAQSPWKLYTVGSAGGQIPALQRLREDARLDGIAVWPFETGLRAPRAPIVLAEIYPSLLGARIRAERGEGEILDAAQVRVTARALASLDAGGRLGALFGAAGDLTPEERVVVAGEEGWILGAGHEAAVRAAAAK